MSFQLVLEDKVGVTVEGVTKDAEGKSHDFKFLLICKRLDTKEFLANGKIPQEEFLTSVVEGWKDVKGPDGKDLEFTASGLEQLLRIPGVALLATRAYVVESGAQEKN